MLADCLQVQPHDTVELSLSTFGNGTSHTDKFDVATVNLHTNSGHVIPLTVLIVLAIAAHWQYCPTQDNPADLLTRGISSSQLMSSTLWRQGPQWLPSKDSWPTWIFSSNIEMQALAVTTTSFIPLDNQVLCTSALLLTY